MVHISCELFLACVFVSSRDAPTLAITTTDLKPSGQLTTVVAARTSLLRSAICGGTLTKLYRTRLESRKTPQGVKAMATERRFRKARCVAGFRVSVDEPLARRSFASACFPSRALGPFGMPPPERTASCMQARSPSRACSAPRPCTDPRLRASPSPPCSRPTPYIYYAPSPMPARSDAQPSSSSPDC